MIPFAALDLPTSPELTHHTACGTPDCGQVRCGDCGERMVCLGPEPRPCNEVCRDCPHPNCGPCDVEAMDRQDERRWEMAREVS